MASLAPALPLLPPAATVRPGPADCARLALRDWRELDRNAIARWDDLADCAAEPNPFAESWYLLPSLRALDGEGEVRLAVLESAGLWLGVLPVVRQADYYGWPLPHWTGWLHANAFLGTPLVAQGQESAFWRALLAALDREGGSALFLHLRGIPLDGPARHALDTVVGEDRRPCGLVHREERALLCSDLAPESYLEGSLSGKKRKELRRQHARLAEQGDLTVERRTDGVGLDEWIASFLALEAAGWKGRNGSALACSPATAQLFAAALEGAAVRGRVERLSLLLDGTPIAMLATFLGPPGAFAYKTAFDERLARFSPGVLLQRENLALLDRAGIAWCDSCAAADHPMIDHFWRERRAVGRLSFGLGGTFRRALFRLLLSAELGRRPTGVTA